MTIVGNTEVVEPFMFGKVMYFSVFYFLCYEMNIYTDMLEDQVLEERDSDLKEEKDIILDEIREDHWVNVAEEGEDKKNIDYLRW